MQTISSTSQTRRFVVRLAIGGIGSIELKALGRRDVRPALLVSYVVFRSFQGQRVKLWFQDWALDSGAFTAYSIGKEISLQSYIDVCKALIEQDGMLAEIYSLDVIGDHQASLRNTEEMWKQGIPAIPCFHIGEPDHVLRTMAATYPKIALGGVAAMRGRKSAKIKWVAQCFARVWPKRIHGFGIGFEDLILRVPFDSVDTTSWSQQPRNYGIYKLWGKRVSVRGSEKMNVRSNVDHYMQLEAQANIRWREQLDELDRVSPRRSLREQAKEIS